MASENSKALVFRIAGEIWDRGNLAAVDEVMVADARYRARTWPTGWVIVKAGGGPSI